MTMTGPSLTCLRGTKITGSISYTLVRKALSANIIVQLCLEFAESGGIRSCAPMLLFRPFGSGGIGTKLCPLLPSGDFWSMVKAEAENIMNAGSEDYKWRFESLHS
jgi:hypothetical protein